MFSHFGYEYVTQYTIPGRTQEGIAKPKGIVLHLWLEIPPPK
jgi:hypothetical protein